MSLTVLVVTLEAVPPRKMGCVPSYSTGLSEQLFSVSREIKVLVFERQGIKIEVFICPDCLPPSPELRHIGLLIEDFRGTLEKARKSGVEVIEGRSGEKTVYFLRDFSGNLIEIKAP